jgi:hypothetical protein
MSTTTMTSEDFAIFLADAITEMNSQVTSVRTFEEVSVLTSNDGLVVRMDDGSEFQITVVRSRA